MDTQTLRTFVVAAQCENFRLTARRRFISQATVTQQVQRLEEELGISLFERTGRSVQLSPAGRRFLPRAERVLQELLAARTELDALHGAGDRLDVASSPHIARTLLPQALRRLSARLPGLEWALSVVPSEDVAREVAEGRSGIGFTRQFPRRSGLHVETVAEDPLELVVSHDGRDLEHPLPDFREVLSRGPLFTCDPEATRIAVDEWLQRAAIRPAKTVYTGQVDVARALLLAGFGAAFLPHSAVLPDVRTGRLLSLDLQDADLPSDAMYAVTPPEPSGAARDLQSICLHLGGRVMDV